MSPASRRRRRFAGARASARVLLAAVCAAACGSERQVGPIPREETRETLRVEIAGCRTILASGVCVLPESRALRLWVETAPPARLEITADGRMLATPGVEIDGGRRFELEIPPSATELTVTAPDEEDSPSWSLALARVETPDWLRQAVELRQAGERGPARRLLEQRHPAAPPGERGIALGMMARIDLRGGEPARAKELLERAVEAHREAGQVFDEHKDMAVLIHLEIQERDFSAARDLLEALTPADRPAEAVYYAAYYQGLLASKVGDSRSALRHLGRAARQARRLGMTRELRFAEQVLGWNLQRLGRSREAAALFARLEQDGARDDPCSRAWLLNNRGWSLLLALEAGEAGEDPRPLLAEALEIWTADANQCFLASEERVNGYLNLALAELHAGRPTAAASALDRARELDDNPRVVHRLWRLDAEARLALVAGLTAEALERYAELDRLAASALAPEARWRAAVGRARVKNASGARAAALLALDEAEALLDEESLQVPFDAGRETFLAQRQAATGLHLDLLLDSGRPAEALAVARRSRSRALRGLRRGDRLAALTPEEQERWDRASREYLELRDRLDAEADDDWRLPADQLARAHQRRGTQRRQLRGILDRALTVLDARSPGHRDPLPPLSEDETVLAYHPLAEGWVAFAAAGGDVAARRFELAEDELTDPRVLAARLLAPFAVEIAVARRMRILPYGALRGVDFHALPFDGDVLLASRPVVYGLDLRTPAATSRRTRTVVLVANPGRDLPAARREAAAVRRALGESPEAWTVRLLSGAEAHGDALRRALPGATLFHYAGHASFAGRGGWESALPLAAGSRLTLSDVLALERLPESVVLSGCETGRTAREAPLASIGLAHAFLAAGSRQVVAAVRPIADRDAADLVADLYRRSGPELDLAGGLRQAQLAWRRRSPDADWQSFRVIEP